MVPWGTGDPISSGDLNTLVFLTEKPPPLSVSIGGGSMSLSLLYLVLGAFIIYAVLKGLFKLVVFVVIAGLVISLINFLL
jgi:hypothetical protein